MRERGFTLVETLVAALVFVLVGVALLILIHSLEQMVTRDASRATPVAIEQQIDALRSDAATSFAAFIPDADIFGASNRAADGTGHEVDFYSRNDAGQVLLWAYEWDEGSKKLQRYDYDTSGNIGQADRQTGRIDAAQSYPALTGVTSFAAQTLEAGDLIGKVNVYGSIIAPLFSSERLLAFPVGFDDGGAPRPDLYGGNTTIQLRLSTEHETRVVHLTTAALPSGFTIREYPEVRAIVYRHDTTHRSWLGLVQKSHVFIQARLLVSYSHFTELRPTVWCDYNLYGYPHGLVAPFQADAEYQPKWFPETTAGIIYHVIHGRTTGSKCSRSPPSSGPEDNSSEFFSPPPDTQGSPPPCFLAGACWPPEAPPDFSPRPAPSSRPPPWWCESHRLSNLCVSKNRLLWSG